MKVRAQFFSESHSHNDYLRPDPLLGAMACGMGSVEADVFCRDGKLYVAHVFPLRIRRKRLTEMYLKRMKDAPQFAVMPYDTARPLVLMVDFKTDWQSTYPVLLQELKPYEDLFFHWDARGVHKAPCMLLLSGSRPPAEWLASQPGSRMACLDGNPGDLGKGISASLMPRISLSWRGFSDWRGKGEAPRDLALRVRTLAEQCAREGKELRFWASPDTENFWNFLQDCGTNICIQTNNPARLAFFLRKSDKTRRN